MLINEGKIIPSVENNENSNNGPKKYSYISDLHTYHKILICITVILSVYI